MQHGGWCESASKPQNTEIMQVPLHIMGTTERNHVHMDRMCAEIHPSVATKVRLWLFPIPSQRAVSDVQNVAVIKEAGAV